MLMLRCHLNYLLFWQAGCNGKTQGTAPTPATILTNRQLDVTAAAYSFDSGLGFDSISSIMVSVIQAIHTCHLVKCNHYTGCIHMSG